MLLKINNHAQHNSGLYGTPRELERLLRSQSGFPILWMGGNTGEQFFIEEVTHLFYSIYPYQ